MTVDHWVFLNQNFTAVFIPFTVPVVTGRSYKSHCPGHRTVSTDIHDLIWLESRWDRRRIKDRNPHYEDLMGSKQNLKGGKE